MALSYQSQFICILYVYNSVIIQLKQQKESITCIKAVSFCFYTKEWNVKKPELLKVKVKQIDISHIKIN